MNVTQSNFDPLSCAVDYRLSFEFTLPHAALSTMPTAPAAVRPGGPLPPGVGRGFQEPTII